jgi:transcriptional regulator with XRE-family HTH domain
MKKIEFADNLKRVAKQREMTQRKLAEMCDVTEATMSRYFNGQRVPNAIAILKMSNALNVSPSELIEPDKQKKYPAYFDYADDGITVTFPDFENVETYAETESEAFEMAKNVLDLQLSYMRLNKIETKGPSNKKIFYISAKE